MAVFMHLLDVLTTPGIIFAAFAGVAWGVVGSSMPGISASIAMALLLPFTYGMQSSMAIVLLASAYFGAEYGGSIPAILIRTPGTNAAAATVLDGYAMKQQGRAGEALGISLYSGILGGIFGLVVLVLLTEPLSRLALAFHPTSYFALGILGLSVIGSLAGENLIKGLMAGVLGLMIAAIGTDPVTGLNRFTFGSPELLSGIPPILVLVGLYALSELMTTASEPAWEKADAGSARIRFPSKAIWKRIWPAQLIGMVVGVIEGVTPGAGGTVAAFIAYNEARRWSRHKDEFGKGAPEGIAAPETANTTVSKTALIPLLSLGIPGTNSTAVLLGGFLIQDLVPGPMLFVQHADIVFDLYVGLGVSVIALLVAGYAFMPPCIWLVNRPKSYLMAFIFALLVSGVYAIEYSLFQVGVALCFGALGYGMRYFRLPFLPMVLGVVLGFLIESNYRRALVLSDGDYSTFVTDPISAGLLAVALLFIVGSFVGHVRGRRKNSKTAQSSEPVQESQIVKGHS
ncbi:putative tricarboxylic transport membrane protein [Rhizobium sp. BK313]|jgi:putative tricarboxylic transport membrane protein|uniref:tripartite tricarboxylate transporter permease n=1 Tax=Rhizobium sp. BK313 TaxID=2587081 RepID=UPI00105E6F99|nr:tripartite tricarboxylate transporter permease [Rhizobium sp. BK313]MBB3458377.1 putative tricarboxylic transport membrane protein [Rhizobium sp. BK313]